MLIIKEIPIPGYRKVIEAIDSEVNLHCFIAVHDCSLGPALGGVRMYPYASPQDALDDVLRLAKSMTYKSSFVEDGLGGGKSVIIADPQTDKTEALFLSFGAAVNFFKGEYIAAEDVGTSTDDMAAIRKKTPYVAALETNASSGDPSRFTAFGVYRGLQAVAQQLWGSQSLQGKRVLIEGLGHVGHKLAAHLFWAGAELILSDLNELVLREALHDFGAQAVKPEDVYKTECDIFSPCALGGDINKQTLPQLRCKAIAGAANNQLAEPELGQLLLERDILYAPDYVINAGGILNAAAEFDPNGYHSKNVRDKVDRIHDRLLRIFEKSERENKPTSQVADEIAEHNLKLQIGKRQQPIKFNSH